MDQLKQQVETWIRRLGSTPVDIDDEQMEWHVRFDYPTRSTHTMHAAQPKGQDGTVFIAFLISVSPEHLNSFKELDPDSREEFLHELRNAVNAVDVDFRMHGIEENSECPKRIEITRTRYDDGLTMDSFAWTVGAVFKTHLKVVWVIQRYLGSKSIGEGGKFGFRQLGV